MRSIICYASIVVVFIALPCAFTLPVTKRELGVTPRLQVVRRPQSFGCTDYQLAHLQQVRDIASQDALRLYTALAQPGAAASQGVLRWLGRFHNDDELIAYGRTHLYNVAQSYSNLNRLLPVAIFQTPADIQAIRARGRIPSFQFLCPTVQEYPLCDGANARTDTEHYRTFLCPGFFRWQPDVEQDTQAYHHVGALLWPQQGPSVVSSVYTLLHEAQHAFPLLQMPAKSFIWDLDIEGVPVRTEARVPFVARSPAQCAALPEALRRSNAENWSIAAFVNRVDPGQFRPPTLPGAPVLQPVALPIDVVPFTPQLQTTPPELQIVIPEDTPIASSSGANAGSTLQVPPPPPLVAGGSQAGRGGGFLGRPQGGRLNPPPLPPAGGSQAGRGGGSLGRPQGGKLNPPPAGGSQSGRGGGR